MNQNLLIVDDEYYVLTWLEEMFRVDFDMEIDVYTAASAYEALELLNRIQFDVVLTDISMPGMDGLELFRQIKGNWPHCKTVFLTGFRDFDNMYSIVNHKDVRYILKSEEDEVIKQAVKDALLEYQKEMKQEQQARIQEKNWERVKLWMRSEFLRRLVAGEQIDEEEILSMSQEAELPISITEPFLIFLVHLNTGGNRGNEYLLQESLSLLFARNLPEDIHLLDYSLSKDQMLFFIQSEYYENPHWNRIFAVSRGAMEYTQGGFQESYGVGFSAMIESTPLTLQTLAQRTEQLKQLMISLTGGKSGLMLHAEAVEKESDEGKEELSLNRLPQMKAFLESRRRKEYFSLLTEYGRELQSRTSMHEPQAIEIYYSIAIMILQFINRNQLDRKIAFEIGIYKLTKLDEHSSWQEAVNYLFQISDAVFQLMEEKDHSLSDHALMRIMAYIDEHLEEDLSLTRLAELGGFNASYLSRLFKQTCQMNILEYVFRKRIDRAKELLSGSNIMIQEVAVKTGYQSANSFARMFRKATGLSPAEYREFHKTGK